MERSNSRNTFFYTSFTIALLFLVVLAACLLGYTKIDQKLYEDKTHNFNRVTEQIAVNFDTVVKSQWESARYCAGELFHDELKTTDAVLESLHNMELYMEYGGTHFLVIDADGICHVSNGVTFPWLNTEILDADRKEEDRIYVNVLPALGADEAKICFVNPLAEEKVVEGVSYTHIVLVSDMKLFDEFLNVGEYGENSLSYIVKTDGTLVYRQQREDSGLSYDIFPQLAQAKFLRGGSYEQFVNDLEMGVSDSMLVEIGGEPYYLAYQEMKENDWYALLFMPEDQVGASSSEFLNSVLLYVLIIGAAVFVLLFAIALMAERRIQRHQLLVNESLQKAVEAEKRANQAKSEFLLRMSHDIRTPLNGMIGMIQLAMAHKAEPEFVETSLQKSLSASDHLLSLINDVLDKERIESDKVEIVNEAFDLAEFCEKCSDIVTTRLVDREMRFEDDFSGIRHWTVIGDELHLRQVLINMLGNAVKFTPDGGRISFIVSEEELDERHAMYSFVVEDTGIGMSEEYIGKVFDTFSQENNGARTQYKGTGLGMSIAKQLTELMGGTIWVESRLNVGSRFTVRLPLEITDEKKAQPVAETDGEAEKLLAGMKVLLVEDNELNMEIVLDTLVSKGVEVTSAINGREALRCFEKSAPYTFDAILMDVMMPIMDGYEATKRIRALEREDAAGVPIVALTANAFKEDEKEAYAAGMNAYLSKPIVFNELFKTLARFSKKTGA